MKIRFVKMHGAGNDFVLVDDRGGNFPADDRRLLRAMGARGTGIGCEGIILVQKSARADFRMRFFNPDGSAADLCGNGARCVAVFAREIGAATGDSLRFETAAGDVSAEILPDGRVRIGMPAPRDFGEDFVVAGVPHKIVPVTDLAAAPVVTEGRRIRYSAEFAPAGTNVDFVCYRPPHALAIRTYERGVEDESGACGTGSVAAAVLGVRSHGLAFPVAVTTVRGYVLTVDGVCGDASFSSVNLTGPVQRVFSGVFEYGESTSAADFDIISNERSPSHGNQENA